ncbi:MAG: hypothetical protein II388_09965 [Clostridia bacterium]|nr:hypothetical protein [Clostridia bacterium]
MKKFTQRYFKNLVKEGKAHDLTGYDFNTLLAWIKKHGYNKIAYSSGVYGINGGLIQDTETGEYYAITARNSALMMIF